MRPAELSAGSGSSKPSAGPTCTVTARGATDEPVVLRVVLLACAEGVPEGDAETRFGDLALGEALGKGLFGESVRVAEVLAEALGVGAPGPRRRCRARRPRARAGYLTPTHPASRLLGDEQRECRDTRLTRGHAAPLFGPDSAPEAVGAPH